MRKEADKEHLYFDMLLRAVGRKCWIAADSCYSNLGILRFHNHMDPQNFGMKHRYCSLVVYLLFPKSMNYSQVAVDADHIDKLNENESHYLWSYYPPYEWSMMRLLNQLLREDMKASVLGLH